MTEIILAALGALVVGLALGWLLASRRGLAELAAANIHAEQAELVRNMLRDVTKERDEAMHDLASERAAAKERQLGHEALLRQLEGTKETLSAQFSEVGAKLLHEAQTRFLQRADERFTQHGEKSEGQLKALLTPVEATLKRYDQKLEAIEKARVGSYGELKEAVAQLSLGNEIVRREAARLTNVLRSSPKHRGRWGEEQLRTILESAGLAENIDFELQANVSDGEQQLRPDCVIKLPGGRCIVIDVKCPLVHFEAAFDEEDEDRRATMLASHADAMKVYAAQLGRKSYWRQFNLSPDFVIMFIPGEHFLAAAAERAPDLIETAFRSNVIIAATINMLALAKIMAGMWRQEAIAKQAQEIAEAGKELYRRLAKMSEHVNKLGRNLGSANDAYNSFIGSLETQVLTQARRFEELKVDTAGRLIESPPIIEQTPRPLVKLASVSEIADRSAEG